MTRLLFILIAFVLASPAFAVIDSNEAYVLDSFAGGVFSKYKVGTELKDTKKAATYVFKYTYGASASAGTYTFGSLPAGAVVTRAFYRVITGFTSEGSNAATIALRVGSTDVKAAAAVSTVSYSTTGLKAGVQDGTFSNYLLTSSNSTVTAVWANNKLTAGQLALVVEYVMAQ